MPTYDLLGDAVRRLSASGTPVVPVPNRWFSGGEGPQHLVEKVLAASGMSRGDFPRGAFVDPRSGDVMDFRVYDSAIATGYSPDTGRPAMFVSSGVPVAADGPLVDTNLVRRSAGWRPVDDAVDVPFLTTAETGGQHHYGLGVSYETPVLLNKTSKTQNPTLRPRARGSVFGQNYLGDIQYGRKTHPVYELLRILPRNPGLTKGDIGSLTDSGTLLRYGILGSLLNQQQPAESTAPAF